MSQPKEILLIKSSVKMPLMALPVITPVVKLSHSMVVISPGPRIDAESTKIRDHGELTDIVAPSLFHHLNVPKAQKEFPDAKLWGVEGFREKCPDISWNETLTESNWPYREEFPAVHIAGMPKVNEVVFLHKASRTLIVADLCFNLREQKGLGPWLILHLFGTYNRFAVSRLWTTMIKDRQATKKSLERLLALDFENIVMSHGEAVWGDGKEMLRQALAERSLL